MRHWNPPHTSTNEVSQPLGGPNSGPTRSGRRTPASLGDPSRRDQGSRSRASGECATDGKAWEMHFFTLRGLHEVKPSISNGHLP